MAEPDVWSWGENRSDLRMTFPVVVDPDMGQAGGFGNPVACGAFHCPMNRRLQINLMPDRNKYRFAILTRPKNGSDGFALLIPQAGSTSLLQFRFPVGSRQSAFGTTNGGAIKKQSHVRGQTQFAGMGHSLSVEENQLWCGGYFFEEF